MVINPVISRFSPNELRSHLQNCDHSIITFVIIGLCSGFSNTYHVGSLYRFRKSVFEKVKLDLYHLMKHKHSKEEKHLIRK